MRTLLIVYHSRTGGARQMAEAAGRGVGDEKGVRVRLCGAADTTAQDVLDADGLVFAAPENLAALSGPMKDFFDRCYYDVLGRLNGRPYASLICAGSDGTGAARQIARIATGWRLRMISAPVIVITGAQTPEAIAAAKRLGDADIARCTNLGAAMAAGLALGIF